MPVGAEAFTQWVLEDQWVDHVGLGDGFGNGRHPDWPGAIFTPNVADYEKMKLRLLNASHSCLAYLAAGLGVETVDAALSDPDLRAYLREFLERKGYSIAAPASKDTPPQAAEAACP